MKTSEFWVHFIAGAGSVCGELVDAEFNKDVLAPCVVAMEGGLKCQRLRDSRLPLPTFMSALTTVSVRVPRARPPSPSDAPASHIQRRERDGALHVLPRDD
jgi:hypothetical protein